MTNDSGSSSWQSLKNHNRMMALSRCKPRDGAVKIAFFGSSAFRITSPAGITIMIDPWRNHPKRHWDWYFHDFPWTEVDIGISTHAHFDHDALSRLDASVLLDRPIGRYSVGDVVVDTIADKHAIDTSNAIYDAHFINSYFGGQKMEPPDNQRSWDNCLVTVETGGLRILHWGDNRHDPPEDVWERLGRIDIILMPVDDSQHVMGNDMVADVIQKVDPRVVIPSHYFTWNIIQRQSTLFTAEKWLAEQKRVIDIGASEKRYATGTLPQETEIHSFGDHVAFDVEAWHRENGLFVTRSGSDNV